MTISQNRSDDFCFRGSLFDLSDVDAISSEGLHFLVSVKDKMIDKKGILLRNVSKETIELLDTDGLSNILTIEKEN